MGLDSGQDLRQELERGRRGVVAPYVSGFTPWGPAQSVEVASPGIVWVSTEGHGGVWVAPHLVGGLAIRPPSKHIGIFEGAGGSAWYEEDCAWSIVQLAYPGKVALLSPRGARSVEEVEREWQDTAEKMAAHYYPEALGDLFTHRGSRA